MNCDAMLELISGHIDGANTQEQEVQLQAHLRQCPSCRAVLQAYEEVDAGILALEEEPPERLAAGVMYQVALASGRGRKRFAYGRWTMLGAAAVLALVLVSGAIPNLLQGLVGEDSASVAADQITQDTAAPTNGDVATSENTAAPEWAADVESDLAADDAAVDDTTEAGRAQFDAAPTDSFAKNSTPEDALPSEAPTAAVTTDHDAPQSELSDPGVALVPDDAIVLPASDEVAALLEPYFQNTREDGARVYLVPEEVAAQAIALSGAEPQTLQQTDNRIVLVP